MIINSVNNNKIKELSKLNNTKYRKDANIFLVEGFHLVEEAYKNNLLKEVYSIDDIDYFDVPITVVSEPVMKKLTNMASIPTMIGVVYKKKDTLKGNKVLILDGIQDPGNLGTIIRSGVAFDVDTIVLSKDTVDLYNSKVVRATEGMLFNINIIEEELIDFIPRLKSMGYKIYSTNVEDGKNIKDIEDYNKYAIIVGNEGNGVKKEISALCDGFIYIKMNKKCESLNVGVATSIILYELKR